MWPETLSGDLDVARESQAEDCWAQEVSALRRGARQGMHLKNMPRHTELQAALGSAMTGKA